MTEKDFQALIEHLADILLEKEESLTACVAAAGGLLTGMFIGEFLNEQVGLEEADKLMDASFELIRKNVKAALTGAASRDAKGDC